MRAGVRFSAHLAGRERDALRELAAREGCSENYLARLAIRAMVGLPVPPWAARRLISLAHATPDAVLELEPRP